MFYRAHRREAGRTRAAVGSCLTILWTAVCLCLPGASAYAGKPYPFDDSGYLGAASLMPDWAATMAREKAQAPVLDACLADKAVCPSYYRGLRQLLLKASDLEPRRRISLVNYYVNRKRYRYDRPERISTPLSEEPLKYRSQWATVEEFLRSGGDCEDYATTKYYLLRRLGFEPEQLRVVVTWDWGERGYHAVLAVQHEGEVLLLESDDTIRRGGRHRYRFIYSVNENAIWDHEAARAAASRSHQPEKEETTA